MNWLGLDIGGANIKIGNGQGFARQRGFPLWKTPEKLTQTLRTLIADAPPCDHLAVTMTGELADCFESKSTGVRAILRSLHEAADGRHTRVYLTDGRFVTVPVAQRTPLLAAASNWRALATFVGQFVPLGQAQLMDCGSTSLDLIPLLDGVPRPQGMTDNERLLADELIYTGIQRSPVCAIVTNVPYRNHVCPVVQEMFATMQDIYIILGDLQEDPANRNTADGRPATKKHARARMARMLCLEVENFNHRDAVKAARAVAESQLSMVTERIASNFSNNNHLPKTVIISGAGEFLLRRALKRIGMPDKMVSLARRLGTTISTCAPAHAVAFLANESNFS